ncbi:MAG: hypothetical protein E7E34_10185 [Staphylococcus epidermidis]|nr:hypothetical protein [Staphylococcus epidermidis]
MKKEEYSLLTNAFTISSIPGILKKKVSGWVLGILGLIFIILFLI